jgi:hypothetical protein
MFYIACNTLAVTPLTTKKKALETWESVREFDADPGSVYELCKEVGTVNPHVVQRLV